MWYVYNDPNAPTPISSCEDFKNIENNLGGNYVLTQDLDCTEYTWDQVMVVTSPYSLSYFSGSLDGADHMIEIDFVRNDHL